MEIKENEKVLTIKDWLKFQLIMITPIINIIMGIKWLISEKTNLNLKNFLISYIIMIGVWVIFILTLWFIIFAYFLTHPQHLMN